MLCRSGGEAAEPGACSVVRDFFSKNPFAFFAFFAVRFIYASILKSKLTLSARQGQLLYLYILSASSVPLCKSCTLRRNLT